MRYQKKVTHRIFTVMLVFLIMLSLAACSDSGGDSSAATSPSSTTVAPPPSATPGITTLESSDGRLSITAPDGWRADNELWAGSAISLSGWDYYVVVLQKPKSDYAASLTANDFLTAAHADFDSLLYNMNWQPSSEITIGNLSGVTVQMDAKNQGNRAAVVYLISIVEDTNNFYEIIGWSGSDRGDLDLKNLEDVMNSFQVK